jgi:hypothetical protein
MNWRWRRRNCLPGFYDHASVSDVAPQTWHRHVLLGVLMAFGAGIVALGGSPVGAAVLMSAVVAAYLHLLRLPVPSFGRSEQQHLATPARRRGAR